jgi:hypothetical protein
LAGNISGQPIVLTPAGGLNFAAHGRLDDGTRVTFQQDGVGAIGGFTMGPQQFERAPARPTSLPPEWRAYCGSYGPDCIPVVVSERHGHLYAMTENMFDYRLTPLNRHVCRLPPGMYTDEQVVFLTESDGRPRAIHFANMLLPRQKGS